MVDAEVGTVGAQVLDRLGELDRLDERVRARPDLRVRRRRPVAERQEADLLHTPILGTDLSPPPGTARLSSFREAAAAVSPYPRGRPIRRRREKPR